MNSYREQALSALETLIESNSISLSDNDMIILKKKPDEIKPYQKRIGEIYEAIFAELSLDILRVRNAFDYDTGMIDRVAEFAQAAESSLGKPIAVFSSSWGPPGYLKSNNDRKNGGTLKTPCNNDLISADLIHCDSVTIIA